MLVLLMHREMLAERVNAFFSQIPDTFTPLYYYLTFKSQDL
jgi:hypothetical protein